MDNYNPKVACPWCGFIYILMTYGGVKDRTCPSCAVPFAAACAAAGYKERVRELEEENRRLREGLDADI